MTDEATRDALRREWSGSAEPALQCLVEAILFASPQPVTLRQLMRAVGEPEEVVRQALEQIRCDRDRPARGIFLRETRGGYQLGTKPELDAMLRQALRGVRPRPPLSRPALETLAMIAYKQPISAPDIQKIRRVEGAGVLDTLLKRKLIATAGHKPDGRAQLYRTTSQFLADFGLRSLQDLPTLPEFKELREQYERLYRAGDLDTGAKT
jgi:segregation and condensation protein B